MKLKPPFSLILFTALLVAGSARLPATSLFTPVEVDMPLTHGGAWELVDTGFERTLHAVAHGSGKYVAVGASGMILYSDDLRAWNQAETPVETDLLGVAYGHGRFAAVGGDSLLLSADGISWERYPLEGHGNLQAIIFADDRFVALPRDYYSLVSEDGVHWTAHPTGFSRDIRHVAYGNGTFVAGGLFIGLYASTDGISWEQLAVPGSYPAAGIAFGEGRWIQTTHTGMIRISEDAELWVLAERPAGPWTRLAYGNGAFVGVAGNRHVSISAEGEQWHLRNLGDALPNTRTAEGEPGMFGLFFVNERFVAPSIAGHL